MEPLSTIAFDMEKVLQKMDESVVHELAKRFGGRFRLTTIIQRRLIELNRGAKPLVEPKETNLRTVIDELMQGKHNGRVSGMDLLQDKSLLVPTADATTSEPSGGH
jgi:DNA-directed RNA polymerase subunit K/omega